MIEDLLRFAHVVGACVLLGTGAGIAFFMVISNRSSDPCLIAHTLGIVVLADFVFTATAVVFQPISGLWLAHVIGWSIWADWIIASILIYIAIGLFWLPVVWMQIRLRKLAITACETGRPLPASYHKMYRVWFAFGFPAFAGVLAIVWLMLTTPTEIW